MLDLKGKVAFVAGAGSNGEGWGNGRATAVLLARQGATVYGTDLSLEQAQETQRLVAQEGGACHVDACDVTRADAVARVVADCMQRFGRIDNLVNNVGLSQPG